MSETTKEKKIYKRTPTQMQLRAIEIWVDSGGKMTKAEALRQADYSEAVINSPSKVFNSPAVMEAINSSDLDLIATFNRLNRKTNSKKLAHMTFPPFNSEKHEAKERGEDVEEEDENRGETRGEQLTDADIIDLLASVECKVQRIVHGDLARHAYYWTDNDFAQLDAIDKVIKLYGAYAPNKSEVKATVTHFSMADLRRNAEEAEKKKHEDALKVENKEVQ